VDTSADPLARLAVGGIPAVVYVAMFGATLGGQLAGMAFDSLVIGKHVLWVPAACSVVLEAVAGGVMAARRLRRPLATVEAARLSVIYSLMLAAVSVPLWGWTVVSTATRESPGVAGAGTGSSASTLGIVLAAFAVACVVRFGLMVLVSARARRAAP
jgi:hypothetical protein